MPEIATGQALDLFKALAHESRLKLLGLVAQGERSVQELSAAVGLKEPTTSHHLAMLRGVGLVRSRPDGTTHWYSLKSETLRQVAKALLAKDKFTNFAPAEALNAYETKVIKGYLLPDGRLKAFPSSRKKRRVFAVWFTRMFKEDRDYRETEVNDTIQRHHNDFETFRREMVGYRMMSRTKGVYRRLPESEWVDN
jgi:DNA-binding transcriptional ArsR family regulator